MSQVLIIKGEFLEGADFKILARVTTHDKAVLTTADGDPTTTTATVNIYDLSGSSPQTAILTNTSLPYSSLITNNLLNSTNGWSQDNIGANFALVVSGVTPAGPFVNKGVVWPAGHPIGGHRYRFETKLVTVNYGTIPVVAELLCRAVYSA